MPSIGIAFFCRRFINHFSKITTTLSANISKKLDFEQTLLVRKSFDALKQALVTAAVTVFTDLSTPFLSETASFSASVGSISFQLDENGAVLPEKLCNLSIFNLLTSLWTFYYCSYVQTVNACVLSHCRREIKILFRIEHCSYCYTSWIWRHGEGSKSKFIRVST